MYRWLATQPGDVLERTIKKEQQRSKNSKTISFVDCIRKPLFQALIVAIGSINLCLFLKETVHIRQKQVKHIRFQGIRDTYRESPIRVESLQALHKGCVLPGFTPVADPLLDFHHPVVVDAFVVTLNEDENLSEHASFFLTGSVDNWTTSFELGTSGTIWTRHAPRSVHSCNRKHKPRSRDPHIARHQRARLPPLHSFHHAMTARRPAAQGRRVQVSKPLCVSHSY